MHIQIANVLRDVKLLANGTQISPTGLSALFHHVAQLAGQQQITLARQQLRLHR